MSSVNLADVQGSTVEPGHKPPPICQVAKLHDTSLKQPPLYLIQPLIDGAWLVDRFCCDKISLNIEFLLRVCGLGKYCLKLFLEIPAHDNFTHHTLSIYIMVNIVPFPPLGEHYLSNTVPASKAH